MTETETRRRKRIAESRRRATRSRMEHLRKGKENMDEKLKVLLERVNRLVRASYKVCRDSSLTENGLLPLSVINLGDDADEVREWIERNPRFHVSGGY